MMIHKNFVTLKDCTVKEAFESVRSSKHMQAVVSDGPLFGVIDAHTFLHNALTSPSKKLSRIMTRLPLIDKDVTVEELLHLFHANHCSILPIENNGKVIGVSELCDVLSSLKVLRRLKVSDVKLSRPKPIKRDMTVVETLHYLHDSDCTVAPYYVKGKLEGSIDATSLYRTVMQPVSSTSKRKINMASHATADRVSLRDLPVSSFSEKRTLATSTTTLASCVKLMHKDGVSGLLVVDSRLKGVLTLQNILSAVTDNLDRTEAKVALKGIRKVHFDPSERKHVDRIIEKEARILKRLVKNNVRIEVSFKDLKRSGKYDKQHLRRVNVKVMFPSMIVAADHEDWKIETALHKAFTKIKNTVKKRYRN